MAPKLKLLAPGLASALVGASLALATPASAVTAEPWQDSVCQDTFAAWGQTPTAEATVAESTATAVKELPGVSVVADRLSYGEVECKLIYLKGELQETDRIDSATYGLTDFGSVTVADRAPEARTIGGAGGEVLDPFADGRYEGTELPSDVGLLTAETHALETSGTFSNDWWIPEADRGQDFTKSYESTTWTADLAGESTLVTKTPPTEEELKAAALVHKTEVRAAVKAAQVAKKELNKSKVKGKEKQAAMRAIVKTKVEALKAAHKKFKAAKAGTETSVTAPFAVTYGGTFTR